MLPNIFVVLHDIFSNSDIGDRGSES